MARYQYLDPKALPPSDRIDIAACDAIEGFILDSRTSDKNPSEATS